MLFEFQSVSAAYGEVPVIIDISLAVSEGEFVSIIGPNGAGKSTILKLVAGEIAPASGRICFRGKPLREWHPRERARAFSYVRQMPEGLMPFSVREFIMMGRFPYRNPAGIETEADREAAEWAAETTGVTAIADRSITNLSGGELQLVRIAHALAQNREILILDEPVTHLDIAHAVRIMDILFELHRRGSTIIAVLHDVNIASDYSSRILGIQRGRLFFSGAPRDVIRYDTVEDLFGTPCIVMDNPTTGRPFVYPVPGHARRG